MARANRRHQEVGLPLSAVDLMCGAVGILAFLLLALVLAIVNTVAKRPLEILTTRLPACYDDGQQYSVTLAAHGSVPPYRWQLTRRDAPPGARVLPPGLEFDSTTGCLSGRLARGEAPEPVTIRLRASVTGSVERPGPQDEDHQDLELRLLPYRWSPMMQVTKPRVVTDKLPDAILDRDYRLILAATGGLPPYTWSRRGDLPQGIELDAESGAIRGRPKELAPKRFEVSITDHLGQTSAPQPLTLVVQSAAEIPPLKIVTAALPSAVEGQQYRCTLAAEGGQPPYSWTTRDRLPPGLELTSGEIAGQPSRAGTRRFRVTLADSAGQRVDARFALEVRPERRGPSVPWWKLFAYLLLYLAATWGCYLIDKWVRWRIDRICARDSAKLLSDPNRHTTEVVGGTPRTLPEIKRAMAAGDKLKWLVRGLAVVLAIWLWPRVSAR